MSGRGRCTASGTRRGGAPLLQRPAAQPTSCTVPTAHPPRAGVQFRRQVGPQRVRGRHRRGWSRPAAHDAQGTRESAPGHYTRPTARSNPATAPWTRGIAGRTLKTRCRVAYACGWRALHCLQGATLLGMRRVRTAAIWQPPAVHVGARGAVRQCATQVGGVGRVLWSKDGGSVKRHSSQRRGKRRSVQKQERQYKKEGEGGRLRQGEYGAPARAPPRQEARFSAPAT